MLRVLLLQVAFKFELEHTKGAIGRIITALQKPAKTGMHTKRMIGFAVITAESSTDFLSRLGPTLNEIDAVDNYWCFSAPCDIVGMHRNMDPMTSLIHDAWQTAFQRNYAKYLPKRQRG
jgi:hypothetical protein